MTTYTFTNLMDPLAGSTGTLPNAINNSGEVVGVLTGFTETEPTFIYDNGSFATVANDPSANTLGVYPYGINNLGQLVGVYTDSASNTEHGFIYSNGSYTSLADPSAGLFGTYALAINDSDLVVGYYYDAGSKKHGFIYNGGTYTNLTDPSAGSNAATFAIGINNSGVVVGNYFDAGGTEHGFIYNGGTYANLTDPAAGSRGTIATGINNSGVVVGNYYDSSGIEHGFIYNGSSYTNLTDPAAGSGGTSVVGIDSAGQAVGNYYDSSGTPHGFVYSNGSYTDLTDPSATNTIVTGVSSSGEVTGYYYNGTTSIGFVAEAPVLFTTGTDIVKFNSLQPNQITAIQNGVDIYNGLGGNDVVTLPNEINYNQFGWTDTPASTFYTGSQVGDTYTVSGGDGSYYIVEGAGTEFITINGNGNSNITAGSGADTITINGNGHSTITAGSGNETLSISGGGTLTVHGAFVGSATIGANSTFELNGFASGGPITFDSSGTGETLQIDGTTMPTNVISEFATGDKINLTSIPVGSLAGGTVLESPNQLQLTVNGTTNNLNLSESAPSDLAFFSASGGGSEFTITPADTADATQEAGILLDATKTLLKTVTALKSYQGGLSVKEFDDIFGPAFVAVGATVDATGIYQKLNTVLSAPDTTPAQAAAAFETAVSDTVNILTKWTLATLIEDATVFALTEGLTSLSGIAAAGTVTEFFAVLATGGLVLGAPVVIGAGVAIGVTLLFTNKDFSSWYDANVKEPVGAWVTSKLNPDVGVTLHGYISGATVFADANGNGQLDPGESSTTTDANGNFILFGGTGPLVAFGGTDVSTGLPFKGMLEAPPGSSVIDPLTTMLSGIESSSGLSQAAAQQKLLAGLGLPTDINLTTFDPIVATKGGDAAGAAAYVALAKVYDTVEIIATALSGAGVSFSKAYADTFTALDNAINALPAGQTLKLDDQATIASLISTISHTESVNLTSAATLAATIVASNVKLDQALAQDGASASLLADVATVQITAQAPQPTVVADFAHVAANGSLTVDAAHGVLANDTDPVPNDTLTVSAVDGLSSDVGHALAGSYGKLTLNADGSYSYIAEHSVPSNIIAQDIFTYTASDGDGGSATSSLTVTVTQPGQTYIAGTPGKPLTSGNNSVLLDGSLLQGQTITAGGGNDAVLAGSNDTISLGNGNDVVNAGANSTITLGGGNDRVIAGPNSTIKLGNGNDTVTSGGNSTITVGNGNDTINVGKGDTITVGTGLDNFAFAQTASGSIGAVTINHFNPSKDLITFSSQLTTAVSYRDNAQGNAVITVDNAGDTITLVGVHASALHPSDFHFV